ncbi:MAG TPA: hypothetical protein VFK05_37065 [Polyangiaceae bacterium]|nr:hypothetical protein [Polyangiaceae bacterium]
MSRSARPPVLGVSCFALALALAAGSSLLGCAGGANAGSPESTLSAYARAVQHGQLAEAYALLSDDAKKTIPFDQFKRMLQENPEQTQELVRALDRPSTGPARITARVSAADGEPLLLVYENGAWRVDGSAIDLYSQAAPEAAAQSFVRAVENKRYDLLLRFVPDSQREGLTEAMLRSAWEGDQKQDMARLIEALKAALPSARFEVVGERATLAYGAGGTIELVREHAAWKVEELK